MSEKRKSALSWFLCIALVGCALWVGFARGLDENPVQMERSSIIVRPIGAVVGRSNGAVVVP